MNISETEDSVRTPDAVEQLLEQATPRPAPPAADEERIRDALRAEWQAVAGRRVARRRVVGFAVAATVVLAATLVFNSFWLNDVAPLQVATIDKSHGSIYLLGEQSELRELMDLSEISAGQTLITGSDSGIGLIWGSGGSLRVDADTRIEFVSDNVVYLRGGQVYFDSQPGVVAAVSSGSALQIQTDHGTVTHLGTQYMTYADDEKLAVSVREGTVAVDGFYYDESAAAGEQLTFAGRGRPSVVNINGYGQAWQWVEATTQDFDVDGRTMQEFLDWVSRETGLQVEFSDAAVMQQAQQAVLRGIVDKAPTEALRLRMMTASLDWRIEGGNLIVTATDSSSGR